MAAGIAFEEVEKEEENLVGFGDVGVEVVVEVVVVEVEVVVRP